MIEQNIEFLRTLGYKKEEMIIKINPRVAQEINRNLQNMASHRVSVLFGVQVKVVQNGMIYTICEKEYKRPDALENIETWQRR